MYPGVDDATHQFAFRIDKPVVPKFLLLRRILCKRRLYQAVYLTGTLGQCLLYLRGQSFRRHPFATAPPQRVERRYCHGNQQHE